MKKKKQHKKHVSIATPAMDKKGLSAAAMALFRQSRYHEAIDAWHRVLKFGADPDISKMLAEAYFRYGLFFYQRESLDKAVVLLQQAVKHNPEKAIYHFHAGLAYHKSGVVEQALQWYQKATNLEPENLRFSYHLALATIAAGHIPKWAYRLKGLDREEAHILTLLLRLLQGRPMDVIAIKEEQRTARVLLFHGIAAWMIGNREKAKALFKKAVEVDSADPWCRCCLGISYAADGDLMSTTKQMDQALLAMDDLPVATRRGLKSLYAWLARLYVTEGKLSEAIAVLEQLLKITPKDETVRFNIAHACFIDGNRCVERNDTRGAIVRWGKALDYRPNDVGAIHNLALAYDRLEESERASIYWGRLIEVWKRQSASKHSLALAHRHLGDTYDRMGLVDKAAAEYRRALTYQQDDVKTYLTLAGIYLDEAMPRETIKLLREAVVVVPQNVELLSCLAEAYVEGFDMRGAARCWKTIMNLDPENSAAREQFVGMYLEWAAEESSEGRFLKALDIMREAEREAEQLGIRDYRIFGMIGNLHLSRKAYEEAEQAYAQACSLEPVLPLTYRIIGEDYLFNGFTERADHYFQQAISRSTNDPTLLVSIGGAYWKINEMKRGNYYFKQAMAIQPNDPHLLVDIAALLIVGHHDEAAKYLKKALKLDKELAETHFYLGSIALLNGDFVKGQKNLDRAKELATQQKNTMLLERIEYIESTLFLRSLMDRYPGRHGYAQP